MGEFTVAPSLWLGLWACLVVVAYVATVAAYGRLGQSRLLGLLTALVLTPVGALLVLWLLLRRERSAVARTIA